MLAKPLGSASTRGHRAEIVRSEGSMWEPPPPSLSGVYADFKGVFLMQDQEVGADDIVLLLVLLGFVTGAAGAGHGGFSKFGKCWFRI